MDSGVFFEGIVKDIFGKNLNESHNKGLNKSSAIPGEVHNKTFREPPEGNS